MTLTLTLTVAEQKVLTAALQNYSKNRAAAGKLDSQKRGKNGDEINALYKPYAKVVNITNALLTRLQEGAE